MKLLCELSWRADIRAGSFDVRNACSRKIRKQQCNAHKDGNRQLASSDFLWKAHHKSWGAETEPDALQRLFERSKQSTRRFLIQALQAASRRGSWVISYDRHPSLIMQRSKVPCWGAEWWEGDLLRGCCWALRVIATLVDLVVWSAELESAQSLALDGPSSSEHQQSKEHMLRKGLVTTCQLVHHAYHTLQECRVCTAQGANVEACILCKNKRAGGDANDASIQLGDQLRLDCVPDARRQAQRAEDRNFVQARRQTRHSAALAYPSSLQYACKSFNFWGQVHQEHSYLQFMCSSCIAWGAGYRQSSLRDQVSHLKQILAVVHKFTEWIDVGRCA